MLTVIAKQYSLHKNQNQNRVIKTSFMSTKDKMDLSIELLYVFIATGFKIDLDVDKKEKYHHLRKRFLDHMKSGATVQKINSQRFTTEQLDAFLRELEEKIG